MTKYLQNRTNVLQCNGSLATPVVRHERPGAKHTALTAASCGKEPTRMNHRVESVQTSSTESTPDSKLPLWLRRTLAAALAPLALTGCAVSQAAPGETPEPAPSTSASVDPTPHPSATETASQEPAPEETEPTETPKTREELVAELEIPAGLSPEEYAAAYRDRMDRWYMAGASEEVYELFYDTSKGMDEVRQGLQDIAAEQRDIFTDALFDEDWGQYPSLVNVADRVATANAQMLERWAKNHNDPDGAEYRAWSEVTGVDIVCEDQSGNFYDLVIHGVERHNWEEIANDPSGNAERLDGTPFTIQLDVFEMEDGTMKIVHMGEGMARLCNSK